MSACLQRFLYKMKFLTRVLKCVPLTCNNIQMVFSVANGSFPVKFPHNYSLEEENLIIRTINSSDGLDLTKFSLTRTRCKRLLAQRKKLGEFKDLHQVLAVESFGVKVLKSLCENILDPQPQPEVPLRRTRNYNVVTPELSPQRIEGMLQVVGLTVGPLSVSWAGIDVTKNSVFCWGHHSLGLSPEIKRHHETQILEGAYDAHSHLPVADTYVMESCVMTGGAQQPANVPVNQQRLQLSTMLLVLLNQGARDRGDPLCVVYQRTSLWCRLYGTLVGSERVSSHAVVEDMIGGAPGPYTPLHVPDDLVDVYCRGTPVKREAMCAPLLLTTSFLDVNVRRLPECLSLLRGRVKDSK